MNPGSISSDVVMWHCQRLPDVCLSLILLCSSAKSSNNSTLYVDMQQNDRSKRPLCALITRSSASRIAISRRLDSKYCRPSSDPREGTPRSRKVLHSQASKPRFSDTVGTRSSTASAKVKEIVSEGNLKWREGTVAGSTQEMFQCSFEGIFERLVGAAVRLLDVVSSDVQATAAALLTDCKPDPLCTQPSPNLLVCFLVKMTRSVLLGAGKKLHGAMAC